MTSRAARDRWRKSRTSLKSWLDSGAVGDVDPKDVKNLLDEIEDLKFRLQRERDLY